MTEWILVKEEVDYSFTGMWYKKYVLWKDGKLSQWNLIQGKDCLSKIKILKQKWNRKLFYLKKPGSCKWFILQIFLASKNGDTWQFLTGAKKRYEISYACYAFKT